MRSAGTGSASGCATTSTAPKPSVGTSASTTACRPIASANDLCASSPPNGTSSSGRAWPDNTSPYVTAPIETSATIGLPSLDGTAIASGFVPASGGPPAGGGNRRGEVAVMSATRPPSASFRTQ